MNLRIAQAVRNNLGSPLSPIDSAAYISWICLPLDNIQDGDVAAILGRVRHNHTVLGLQKPTHDVKNRGLSDCFGLSILVR